MQLRPDFEVGYWIGWNKHCIWNICMLSSKGLMGTVQSVLPKLFHVNTHTLGRRWWAVGQHQHCAPGGDKHHCSFPAGTGQGKAAQSSVSLYSLCVTINTHQHPHSNGKIKPPWLRKELVGSCKFGFMTELCHSSSTDLAAWGWSKPPFSQLPYNCAS